MTKQNTNTTNLPFRRCSTGPDKAQYQIYDGFSGQAQYRWLTKDQVVAEQRKGNYVNKIRS